MFNYYSYIILYIYVVTKILKKIKNISNLLIFYILNTITYTLTQTQYPHFPNPFLNLPNYSLLHHTIHHQIYILSFFP